MKREAEGCSPGPGGSELDRPLGDNRAASATYPHGKRDLRARAATWMRVASGLILAGIAAISWWLAISSGCATGAAAVCRSKSSAHQTVRVGDLARLTEASVARRHRAPRGDGTNR